MRKRAKQGDQPQTKTPWAGQSSVSENPQTAPACKGLPDNSDNSTHSLTLGSSRALAPGGPCAYPWGSLGPWVRVPHQGTPSWVGGGTQRQGLGQSRVGAREARGEPGQSPARECTWRKRAQKQGAIKSSSSSGVVASLKRGSHSHGSKLRHRSGVVRLAALHQLHRSHQHTCELQLHLRMQVSWWTTCGAWTMETARHTPLVPFASKWTSGW
jgi:hypothetical protein